MVLFVELGVLLWKSLKEVAKELVKDEGDSRVLGELLLMAPPTLVVSPQASFRSPPSPTPSLSTTKTVCSNKGEVLSWGGWRSGQLGQLGHGSGQLGHLLLLYLCESIS